LDFEFLHFYHHFQLTIAIALPVCIAFSQMLYLVVLELTEMLKKTVF
jgi:hypothetical protein